MAGLLLLPENPEVRKTFDHFTKQVFGGDAIKNVISNLEGFTVGFPPQGTLSQTLVVLRNEVVKAIPEPGTINVPLDVLKTLLNDLPYAWVGQGVIDAANTLENIILEQAAKDGNKDNLPSLP